MISPILQKLLDRLTPSDRVDTSQLESAIYDARYTGITVHHWLNGRLRQVDLGAPIRLSIVEGSSNGVTNGSVGDRQGARVLKEG